jgi:hypothetical protein
MIKKETEKHMELRTKFFNEARNVRTSEITSRIVKDLPDPKQTGALVVQGRLKDR